MSKFAVEAFSDGLRYEMKPFGISVHLIEPGMVKTNILNPENITKGLENTWNRIDDNMKEEYGNEFLKTRELFFKIYLHLFIIKKKLYGFANRQYHT